MKKKVKTNKFVVRVQLKNGENLITDKGLTKAWAMRKRNELSQLKYVVEASVFDIETKETLN